MWQLSSLTSAESHTHTHYFSFLQQISSSTIHIQQVIRRRNAASIRLVTQLVYLNRFAYRLGVYLYQSAPSHDLDIEIPSRIPSGILSILWMRGSLGVLRFI